MTIKVKEPKVGGTEILNILGRQGWELITVYNEEYPDTSFDKIFYFKRKLD